MKVTLPDLPVAETFPALDHALETQGQAVLVAPPGAGKSTLLPLHLLDASWRGDGTVVLLEPRRLSARAVARRMAFLLGEDVGQTVGYRMRMDQAVSAQTRILVVTEGVFSRMVLDDPELPGIAAVLFDEFHERSLDADFGLALALDVRDVLRPGLRLVVMSATLDGARVAALMNNALVIESTGRSHPVTIRYRPRKPDERMEEAVASAVLHTLAQEAGSLLAFLPGMREIEKTAALLKSRLGQDVLLTPLYGALDARAQDAAIRPPATGKRKVVLATSIAESSLTIEGVRLVVDSGLSRVPVFEPAIGLTRLETVRASRASVDQRAGRAGRNQHGVAVRLWHEGQTAALQPYSVPEILAADLAGLVLDCAAFGISDPATLRFLDPLPGAALNEARQLLLHLGAIDKSGHITPVGRSMRRLNLPVRLAHMVAGAAVRGETLAAAELAVILSERGLGGKDVDIDRRLDLFRRDRSERASKARALARRIAKQAGGGNAEENSTVTAGTLLMDAWPDRVAHLRGGAGQYLLANGRGALLDSASALSTRPWLVVGALSGKAEQSRILAAAEVDEDIIRKRLGNDIHRETVCFYDSHSCSLRSRLQETLGAIVLQQRQLPPPSGDEANAAWIAAVRQHGLDILPWDNETENLRRRLFWLRQGLGDPWPDVQDKTLRRTLEEWLLPFLPGTAQLDGNKSAFLGHALLGLVPYELQRKVDELAPTHFVVPTGSRIPVRYEGEAPVLSVRVQELYGMAQHPAIAGNTVLLLVELLSPAGRPIQITRDLPGFWKGSWKDVLSDMRGRYPKHLWPDDPLKAAPTRRAKSRKG